MEFDFTKDQEMIRETVKKFLENECPKDKVRELRKSEKGYDPDMWNKMVELGWMGLNIPEEYDGIGAEYMDLVVLMEEMGRNILPSPFFPTVALCSIPIVEFGSDEQKKNILPKISCEGQIWTLALLESSVSYEPLGIELDAASKGDDFILNGAKLFVSYANVAENFLVVARTSKKDKPEDGISVFIVDAKSPGIKINIIPTTANDMRCEVIFENVSVPKANILGEKDSGWDVVKYILQYATILKCAEISGGAQAVLDVTNQYAKERVQFGKPLGALQAIQHRIVNMLFEVEGLKYLVYEAAWQINTGSPSNLLISMVKAKANIAYQQVCFKGVSVHGAIGFSDEMDVGLHHVLIKSSEFELGGTDFHRELVAKELEDYEPLFLSM